jgi:hypothetical protein
MGEIIVLLVALLHILGPEESKEAFDSYHFVPLKRGKGGG